MWRANQGSDQIFSSKSSDQEYIDERSDRITSDQGSRQILANQRSDKSQQLGCLKGVGMDPMGHNGLESSYIIDPF